MIAKICNNGCNSKYHAKGYCRKCYDKLYRDSDRGKVVYRRRRAKLRLFGKLGDKESSRRYYYSIGGKIRRAKYLLHRKDKFSSSEEFREHIRACRRLSAKKRLRNINNRLHQNISVQINLSLKTGKDGKSWPILVGYNVYKLKKHLEVLFTEGMTWGNYGLWHVDHRIPKAKFNFNSYNDIDFKRCWSLSNLQPLWAKENRKKSDKIIEYFQPSLTIASIG